MSGTLSVDPTQGARVSASGVAPHVAIVGAGIIGLSIAWRLVQRGCRVDVFDAGGPSQGRGCFAASRASAGLLAPGVEAEPTEDALHELCLRSLSLWPAFARELEGQSTIPLDFRSRGSLVIALTRDDVKKLEHTHSYHEALGTAQRWLTRAELGELEPNLEATALAARHLPNDRQVDPRAVLVALRDVLGAHGVAVHQRRVDAVALGGARPMIVTELGQLEADYIVVAAGAWSRSVGGIPDEWKPPVHPVKGQMLSVELPDSTPLLQHAVFTPRVYLVPRTSGRLLIGATVEDRGFEDGVTAGGLLHLLEGAWRAMPAVESARVVETWCGFRPGSRDDAPMIGHRDERLLFATGHYRNGILLAPATADAIAMTICDQAEPDWISAFAPARFDADFAGFRNIQVPAHAAL